MQARRLALAFFALTAPLSAASNDRACESLEGETIRWLVPSEPGGGYDAYSRLIQPFLEKRLKARIFIENRPEAGGLVAAAGIRDARPDGKTLGLINATGLLAAQSSAQGDIPDPSEDFTVLARVVSNDTLLFTGRDSGIASIDELLKISATRPLVVGMRDAGSSAHFLFPLLALAAGLNYELVTGYVGSTSRVFAAIRGEVDIILQTLDSVMPYVNSGELVPLLRISGRPGSGNSGTPAFPVPTLEELISKSAPEPGEFRSINETVQSAVSAISVIQTAGRLVAAPPGLPEHLESCLQTTVLEVLQDIELNRVATAAGLTIEPADAIAAMADLLASKQYIETFAPLVRAAQPQARE